MTDAPLERLGGAAGRTGVSGAARSTRAARSATLLALAYLAYLAFLATDRPALLVAGAAAAALFFVLESQRLAAIGRLFMIAIPASAGLVLLYATDPLATLERALASGLFLTSFIAALGTLRVAAAASPLIQRSGRHLLAQPPRRAYAVLYLGASLSATVLLFGVINLFGTMIAQAADPIRHARRLRRAMLAILRGYAAMPAWSPLALPFALLSVGYPDVDWFATLPYCAAVVAVITLTGFLADRLEFPEAASTPASAQAGAARDLASLAALVAALVACVGALAFLTELPIVQSAMVAVPIIALGWLARALAPRRGSRLARIAVRRLSRGVTAERSILAVMAGAGFCGIALGALVPAEGLREALAAATLPAWAMPALVMAPFMLLGQVGFSPTLTFITLSVTVPDPAVLGLPPVIFYATILGVWGLASIGTPFSVPALATARLFGETPLRVVYCWSPFYLIGAPLAVATLLGLLVAAGAG